MVRLENYFFEPNRFKIKYKEIGSTNRGLTGTVHTQTVREYKNFSFRIEGISETELNNLLYLLSLNRGDSPQNLNLVDYKGNEYEVTIPVNSVDYDREEGEESYYFEMELWEVV